MRRTRLFGDMVTDGLNGDVYAASQPDTDSKSRRPLFDQLQCWARRSCLHPLSCIPTPFFFFIFFVYVCVLGGGGEEDSDEDCRWLPQLEPGPSS